MTVRIPTYETSYAYKVSDSLIKVKSCNALSCMLLVYSRSYLDQFWGSFGCLSSRHCIFTWERMWGTVVIFHSQKGSASKSVWV